MNFKRMKRGLIKLPYWLGIGADALWAAALFHPPLFGILTGTKNFAPDFQVRQIMAIGGILMLGWTVLLVWALRDTIERRFIALITACPVVLGLFMVSLTGYSKGNSSSAWILIKTALLFILMITSYLLARSESRRLD